MEEEKIDPGHSGIRDVCRVVGPLVLGAGILLIVIGIGSFFVSMGSFGPPKYFWCAFVGMPLAAVGSAITKFGYMGRIARYMAGEMAPVAKDTFNYMADGTKEGVRTVASAIGEGIGAGMAAAGGAGADLSQEETRVRCHKCNFLETADAKFCSGCGGAMQKDTLCPACNELNDADAKFCDNCGHSF